VTDLGRSLPPRPAPARGADPVSLTAAPPPKPRPAKKLTKKDGPLAEVVAVWEAEAGRCEACTRAMNRTCARVATLSPSGVPRLLCPDCKQHRPDPLTTAVVGPQTAQALAEARATTVEASAAWLVAGLRAYGVLLRLDDRRRRYWLPGVGIFALFQHAASPPTYGRRPARQAQATPDDPRQTPGPHAWTASPAAAGRCGTGMSKGSFCMPWRATTARTSVAAAQRRQHLGRLPPGSCLRIRKRYR